MALTIGNKSNANATPGASTQTLSHNQNVGDDGLLLVVITMPNGVDFTGCTYGGNAMTLIRNTNYTGLTQRQASYYIQTPPTGANNIVVSFSGAQWSNSSVFAVSFTGAGGIGNDASTGASATPNSQSLTVSANSVIYATGISVNAQSFGYDIAGSTRTNEFAHNTNKQVGGALSATGLSAGATNVTTKTNFDTVTNYRVEVLEAVAVTPTLAVSTATLSGFTYVAGSGPSSEQTFTVSGNDLTANATVTAPTNYEVSKTSGSGFASSVSLTQSGGDLTGEPVTVYVRLKTGLSAGSYNSEVTTISSTGATNETVTLNGSVTAPTPSLTISTSTLSGFIYAEGSGVSLEQTFTVSGDDLTASVTATAPTNYEVSVTSGSGFGTSVVLTQSGGDIVGEPVTVYVRLKAGLTEGVYNSEDITLTSTGATNETVTLNGSVTAPPDRGLLLLLM